MTSAASRLALVRRGRWLSWATLAYNCLEGLIALTAGVIAGSIALVGFGADSLIELAASVFALWRLGADVDAERRERVERLSHRGIGILFLALALLLSYDATVRPRFVAIFPHRPPGVRERTDIQPEIIDGRGKRTLLEDRWITWEP